jgi:hypothetical protein
LFGGHFNSGGGYVPNKRKCFRCNPSHAFEVIFHWHLQTQEYLYAVATLACFFWGTWDALSSTLSSSDRMVDWELTKVMLLHSSWSWVV